MKNAVVFMSDFGLSDGAVSAMHGVADSIDSDLRLADLTHDIPQFNIWEASYRLLQAMKYWKEGTVFVCVCDPGVGSDRKSIACKTKSNHYVVTPDNGTISHINHEIQIIETREISEASNRLKESDKSYTFHGRDVYAYTGARLASGIINFEDIGDKLKEPLVTLDIKDPILTKNTIEGTIDILDSRYGSLWTNISYDSMEKIGIKYGDDIYVEIQRNDIVIFGKKLKFCKSFNEVSLKKSLVYINSLLDVAIAINQGNFSQVYNVGTGAEYKIKLLKKGVRNEEE